MILLLALHHINHINRNDGIRMEQFILYIINKLILPISNDICEYDLLQSVLS